MEIAEKMSGINVKKITFAIKSQKTVLENSKGVVAVGRVDGEVSQEDINRSLESVQSFSVPLNREIIHVIPRYYRLDDQENIKNPLGMKGVRLEVNASVVEEQSNYIGNLNKAVYQAGREVKSLVFSPLAAAEAVLDKKQKELGVAVLDIGATSTSLSVFEEDELVYCSVLPIGASHITNDIAIGLRVSIEVAEKVKLEYGSAFAEEISDKKEIDLSRFDSREEGSVYLKHIVEYIEARLDEIFELVNKELKKAGKAGLLPAGVVLVGGGSKLPGIVDFAKEKLGLPAQIGYPQKIEGLVDKVDDPTFATTIGLLWWEKNYGASAESGFMGKNWKVNGVFQKAKEWIDKFMP